MSSRTRIAVLLVTAPIIAFAVVGGFLGQASARDDATQHLRVFEDVITLILNNYVEGVNVDKVMRGAMRGLAEGLDPDSAYLTQDQVRLLQQKAPAAAGDVGLELTRQYYLRVVAARDGSPAARARLMPGDYVRGIDGQSTRDLSVFEGLRLLRGEPGSKVALSVIRGNAAEPHEIELVRERYEIDAREVTGRIVEPGVGYVRIAAFEAGTRDRLRQQLAELSRAGATRLVIDLRSSAFGQMDMALEGARLFVRSGTLATRVARGTANESFSAGAADGSIALPAALLVDAGTAGPAELFAAALSGNKRADLVGEQTQGRAAEQKLVVLPDGSGLWISGAWYLTPAGAPIHEKGLAPDVEVEQAVPEFGATSPATDPVLDKALERLKAR